MSASSEAHEYQMGETEAQMFLSSYHQPENFPGPRLFCGQRRQGSRSPQFRFISPNERGTALENAMLLPQAREGPCHSPSWSTSYACLFRASPVTGRHGARHGAPTEREDLALELSPAGEATAMDSLRVVTGDTFSGSITESGEASASSHPESPGKQGRAAHVWEF